jgi:hypothetical protein
MLVKSTPTDGLSKALYSAVYAGQAEAAEMLLKNGASANSWFYQSTFGLAAEISDLQMMSLLIENGAVVNQGIRGCYPDIDDERIAISDQLANDSPLTLAISLGKEQTVVVQFPLTQGAKVDHYAVCRAITAGTE